jgi:hypothetical protein
MDKEYYFRVLYPLQDRVIGILSGLETEFYLTGGTAASRGYLNHRFSDDLDFFVNDAARFVLWAERLVQSLSRIPGWRLDVTLKEERFVRVGIRAGEALLKVEMINDVPSRSGEIRDHPVLGRLDSPENILANKVSALLDRGEPKDLADIWGFCCRMGLSLNDAIRGAQSKAAGVFPADLGRALCTTTSSDWELIRWIEAPDVERFKADLDRLGESLILGKPAC